jgi:aerobic carbon-monoxide dehydrogenase large subunit
VIEVAFRDDGRILGMKVETLGNIGAYLSNMASGRPTVNTVSYGTGTYKIENFEAVSKAIVTNTVPVDAYRGYGQPEGAYIAEHTIEAIARHLNLDAVAVRRTNLVPQSEFPYRPYGSRSVIHDSGDYQGCLDKAVAAFGYAGRREEQARTRRRSASSTGAEMSAPGPARSTASASSTSHACSPDRSAPDRPGRDAGTLIGSARAGRRALRNPEN